jgi:ribosomal-protein-alanine N-acetyltransferase
MKTLQTDRVTLVPVEGSNARELWEVLNAPDLRRFQDIPRVRPEEFERQVRTRPKALRASVNGRFEWILRAGEPPVAVGWISLRVNDRVGEIGYSLVREARGHGFAGEALGAVVDEGFQAGELEEIQACIVPENVASRAVLDRNGFLEQRLLRGGAVIRGRHVDVMLFSHTRAVGDRARREGLAEAKHG